MKLLTLLAAISAVATASAQLSPGNLAVVRIGNGTETLGNTGNSAFIDQFTTAFNQSAPVNTIIIPNSGGNALIMNGTSTSEGYLKQSTDGSILTFGGYNAPVGAGARLDYTTATTTNRAVGQVNAAGNYSQPYKTSAAFGGVQGTAGQVRSVVSDGSSYWAGGTAGGSSTGGTRSFSSGTETTVESGIGDRCVGLFGGNLMFSVSSSTYGYGIRAFNGTPTAGASSSLFLNTGASASPYDFSFNPGMTLAYVADDRSSTSGGGIQKWELIGGTWTLDYTFKLLSDGVSTFTARGLTVDWSGASPVIYATTTATSANKLVAITDTGSGSLASILAAAQANTVFRGVAFTPVPEPSSCALLGFGLAFLCKRLRRAR